MWNTKTFLAAIALLNLALLLALLFLVSSGAPDTPRVDHDRSASFRNDLGQHFGSPHKAPKNKPTAALEDFTRAPSFENPIPTIQMPAAIAEMNPEVFLTTDLQVAEWEALQEEFINEVGNKLPENAAEWQRWKLAQKASDEMFRIKFGEEIYRQQAQAAAREGSGYFK